MRAVSAFGGSPRLECRTAIVALLLQHGADPNRSDPMTRQLPLHLSLSLGNLACAEQLRAAGADVNAQQEGRESTLAAATKGAILTGDNGLIRSVLSWGIPIETRSRGPRASTALHTAVWYAKIGPIRALLELGSDHCARNSAGLTALDLAKIDANPRRPGSIEVRDFLASLPACLPRDSAKEPS